LPPTPAAWGNRWGEGTTNAGENAERDPGKHTNNPDRRGSLTDRKFPLKNTLPPSEVNFFTASQCLGGDQLHAPPEKTLEEIRKRKEPIEALAAGLELDKQVHVAIGIGFSASHGTEQRNPPHTHTANLIFHLPAAFDHLVSIRSGHAHGQHARENRDAREEPESISEHQGRWYVWYESRVTRHRS